MDIFIEAIRAYIARHGLLAPGDRVLVGLSGGPDSVALLHALLRLGYAVEAAHLDHGLREAAGAEAAWVQARCREWGVAVHVERASISPRGSMEEAAREARYAFLNRVALAVGAGAIALGHHQGDQAETLLFRLARGTGPAGLAGMRPLRRQAEGPPIVRPMLGVTRQAIEGALAAWGLAALTLTDPSNADWGPARNRIRHGVLPELGAFSPDAARHLATLAELVGEEEALWEEETLRLAKYIVRLAAPGWAELDRASLQALPAVRQRRVLRLIAARLGAPAWDAAGLGAISAVAARGGAVDLALGWRVYAEDDAVVIDGNLSAPEPVLLGSEGAVIRQRWGWDVAVRPSASARPAGPTVVLFDARALPPGLQWRSGRPDADVFTPWGHRDPRSLRHFLARAGVPGRRQGGLLVLAAGDEVFWVVGVRRGSQAAVAEAAEHVWEMQAAARFWV